MKKAYLPEWRTNVRWKRKFYSSYMRWLERGGYLVAGLVTCAFVYGFTYKVDELIAADGVELKPLEHAMKAEKASTLVKFLVEPGTEVKAGTPVAELSTPEPFTVRATEAGIVRMDLKPGSVIEAGATIFSVIDPNIIELEAILKGDSASLAKVGQVAKISGISIAKDGTTLLRAMDGNREWISGAVLGEEVKVILEQGLKGQTLATRIDPNLKVSEITEIAVDARLSSKSSTGADGVPLEPDSLESLSATVIDGSHTANVQLSELPPELQTKAKKAVEAALARHPVTTTDGTSLVANKVEQARFVVKVKAVPGDPGAGSIAGASLGREFKAKLRITNPPNYLIAAARAGRKITAKVELPTSQKPLALTLLKKS